jgi:hypothetical protein
VITIPTPLFVTLVLLLVLCLAGWGWTIRRSFNHALTMYDRGDKDGYRRGCLAYLKAMERMKKSRKRK